MNHIRSKEYKNVTLLSDHINHIDPTKCPICYQLFDDINTIEFLINNKHMKACSYVCMTRIKNLYNYIINS
jgi:hypothetical protein